MAPWQFRRGNKRSAAIREYSEHEGLAWCNRPYGCHSLKEAVEHYRMHDEKYARQHEHLEWLKDHNKRRREWDTVPEWCYKHEHPLKTGRPGRLYHKSDIIQPVIDAIRILHDHKAGDDAFGIFTDMDAQKKKRRKKDGYDEAEEKETERIERERVLRDNPEARREAWKKSLTAPAWTCACCGNTDIKTQVQHKDALLCPCGFVVRLGGEVISTHREKLGAEESEDKTQHADKPYESRTDKYDMERVPTVTERRNERKYSAQATKVGGRTKGAGRLCDVQRISNDIAAKETLQAEVAAGIKLTPKDETKGWNIIAQINELAKQLAPVEHEVKRALRREADVVWHTAVRHCRTCTRTDCCELRLIERTPAIIAASVFETTIERMLHDENFESRVTRQHLLDVQMRMQRSTTFTNAPAITQMATAKAMINIMRAPDFDPEMVCAPTLPGPSNIYGRGAVFREAAEKTKPQAPSIAAGRVPFGRNDSSISCGGASPTPTGAVMMRDAVSTVFLAHRSGLPVAVRDGCMRALQSPGFVEAVKALPDLKTHSLQCMAFCILNAVHREQAASDTGPSFTAVTDVDAAFNVGIAMKLNLDLAVAEGCIHAIRALVPTDATSEASTGNDDDLFS